jgi:hypothetical protein
VNTDTNFDAVVNVQGSPQTFGLLVSNGNSSGVVNNSYLFDPAPATSNCLTKTSGDTRVNTGVYTCP